MIITTKFLEIRLFIYIPQYPRGKKLSYSKGEILSIGKNKYEIIHTASTEQGSSGSPIFLSNTNQVIGIHAGTNPTKNKNENIGYFIYPVINILKNGLNEFIIKINKAYLESKNNRYAIYGNKKYSFNTCGF